MMTTMMSAMMIEASRTFPVSTSLVPGLRTHEGLREKMTSHVRTAMMMNQRTKVPRLFHICCPSMYPMEFNLVSRAGISVLSG